MKGSHFRRDRTLQSGWRDMAAFLNRQRVARGHTRDRQIRDERYLTMCRTLEEGQGTGLPE
jgi:hypothetical protein